MATIAVGDIHGNLAALRSLLDALLPSLGSRDTLVFLGDYIDRGPDSKGCIETILQLRKEAPFSVVSLLGNHEAWMLATMDDYGRHSWLLGADAFETVESYSPAAARALRRAVEDAGPELIVGELELPYGAFFESMPESHQRFFRELRLFHRGDGALFVHAGIDPEGGPPERQDVRELIWGFVPGFPHDYRGPENIVYGHRSDCVLDGGRSRPRVANGRTYGIDSIWTGVLTAIRMPDLKVFQSEMPRHRGRAE